MRTDELAMESHLALEEKVRQRAHEIWRSHAHNGNDTALDDWLQAEQEVLGRDAHQPAQDRGTVVGDAHAPDMSRMEGYGEG
jgi:ParB-like chromosome segregation protein Spo0J